MKTATTIDTHAIDEARDPAQAGAATTRTNRPLEHQVTMTSADPDTAAAIRLLTTALGEEQARRVIATFETRQAQRQLDEQLAVDFAVRLLDQRVERPVIRDRLMARYQLSKRTAHRRIDTALKVRQKGAILGGPPAHAPGIETTDQG